MDRVFLISPASVSGRRASVMLREGASFDVAVRLRRGEASLGEVMTFLSGLYFRGKLAYARAFGRAAGTTPSALVITSGRGLVLPESRVDVEDLVAFASQAIDADDPGFTEPLLAGARALDARLAGRGEVVLLGSIATGKYTRPLLEVFGARLLFPADFVGRGDMSRGGLLLRAVADGRELAYAPVEGAVLTGARPPKLPARTRRAAGEVTR